MSEEIRDTSASTSPAVGTLPPPPQPEVQALGRVLDMADHYLADNLLRQAAEMYFEVMERCNSAPEAARARLRLMEIAAHYENAGALHQARGIYERLL